MKKITNTYSSLLLGSRNAPRWFGCVLISVLPLACGGANDDGDPLLAEHEEELFFNSATTLWNNNQLGSSAAIPVCFTTRPREVPGGVQCVQTGADRDCFNNQIPAIDALRAQVRSGAENSWMRAANIELFGWGNCPVHAPTGRHRDVDMPGTIVITFTNGDSSAVGRQPSGPTVTWFNWQALQAGTNSFNLVHEFGHALGFWHEWQRQDWTGDRCGDPVVAGTALSVFPDQVSKMEYCVGAENTLALSSGDILGVQRAYGRKWRNSIVGHRGQCVGASGGSSASGTPLIAFPCRGQTNDTWSRFHTNQQFRATIGGQTRCVQASTTLGGQATSSTCSTTAPQGFPLTGMEWRVMGNMCVTAIGGTTNRLEARTCNGSSNQKWNFMATTTTSIRSDMIKSVGTGRCASTSSTSGALGQELTLATCSVSDGKQRFTFPGQGIIGFGSFCMSEFGGLPTSGSRIVLWNGCTANPRPYNHQHFLSGNLKGPGGACLDIAGGGNPGDAIISASCVAGDASQVWDYYF